MIRTLSLLAASAFLVFGTSCERHDWEETKVLHHHGGGHGDDHGGEHAEHGEDHGAEHGDHDGHGH